MLLAFWHRPHTMYAEFYLAKVILWRRWPIACSLQHAACSNQWLYYESTCRNAHSCTININTLHPPRRLAYDTPNWTIIAIKNYFKKYLCTLFAVASIQPNISSIICGTNWTVCSCNLYQFNVQQTYYYAAFCIFC